MPGPGSHSAGPGLLGTEGALGLLWLELSPLTTEPSASQPVRVRPASALALEERQTYNLTGPGELMEAPLPCRWESHGRSRAGIELRSCG